MRLPFRRYDVWKKIWEWLKEYGGYILAFIGGIASYFFIDRRGNARTDEYIATLNARLAEYEDLVERLEYHTGELTRNINSMEATSGELRAENNKLRDILGTSNRDISEARHSLTELRTRLESAEGDIDRLAEIDRELGKQSTRIDGGFQRLAEFIEKYGATDSPI
jgi:chromosome segregation ATPase